MIELSTGDLINPNGYRMVRYEKGELVLYPLMTSSVQRIPKCTEADMKLIRDHCDHPFHMNWSVENDGPPPQRQKARKKVEPTQD